MAAPRSNGDGRNHAVPADQLLEKVRSLAERIALTPPDLLALKKASITTSMDAMGARQALASPPEYDALAHTTESVKAVKARIAAEGLKSVIESYRVPSTTDLSR